MEKKRINLIKSELIPINKPNKIIKFFTIENNISQRDSKIISSRRSLEKLKESKNNKIKNKNYLLSFSKAITSSNSFKKKYILISNDKNEFTNKINLKKKISPRLKINNNTKRKNNLLIKSKNTNPNNSKTSSNKHSFINKYSNDIYCNHKISRNNPQIRNNPSLLKNNNLSFVMLNNDLTKKENKNKIVNKNSSSLNYLYKRYKTKFNYNNNIQNKKKYINLNQVIPMKGKHNINLNNFSNLNSTGDFNNSNHINLNKMFININDFKKFSIELLKRRIKTNNNKVKNNVKFYKNNNTNGELGQSSLRINKKESFISTSSTIVYLDNKNYKKINNIKSNNKKDSRNNNNKIYNKNNKEKIILNIIKKSKNSTNRSHSNNKKKINYISHSSSINQLLNNYINCKTNKFNLLSDLNNKKLKIRYNKKRNINYNLTDINNLNNSTKEKSIRKFSHHPNDIINITIDNTINNIVNINGSLNNNNNTITNNSNSREKVLISDNNKIIKNKMKIKKQQNISEKKIKNRINTKYNNKTNIYINSSKENDKNNKKIKSQSYKSKMNNSSKFKSEHNLLFKNWIKNNNLKENNSKGKRKNKLYHSKNKIKRNQNDIILNENLKKIREKRKKKCTNLSILSINNMKLNSNIKLIGIKTIFSNFYNVDKKKYLMYKTPKLKRPSSFNNLNYLNISSRFNKTEEKIDIFKNIPKNEDINQKFYIKIKNNPQYSFEYIDDILQNLLIEENQYFEELNFNSFESKENYKYCINPESWKFFINSLINIQDLLFFDEHTLFLTIYIFDKYISSVLYKEMNKKIVEENLDIVIVTSLIIASKREEIKLYSMKDYLNLLPDKYSIKDLIKQENDILYKFKFNLLVPNAMDFFEIFSILYKLDKVQKCKGLYLLNVILLDCNLLRIPPSLISYCIIKIITKRNNKTNILNRIDNKYKYENKYKEIKSLKILKDDNTIDSICGYILYIEKCIRISNYDSVMNKFNNAKNYYVPSYVNI